MSALPLKVTTVVTMLPSGLDQMIQIKSKLRHVLMIRANIHILEVFLKYQFQPLPIITMKLTALVLILLFSNSHLQLLLSSLLLGFEQLIE